MLLVIAMSNLLLKVVLFLTDDSVDNIDSDIYIFPDDTSLMWPIINPAVNFDTLNSDLNKLFRWAHQWHAAFKARIEK